MKLRKHAYMLPLVGILCLGPSAGCARNPVTGELQLALISEAQEIAIGRQSAEEVERSIGLVDDPALQSYVSSIGQRMAAASERPDLPWRFGVVDDPTPNAFALPGGFVYVTRGMMNLMTTEAQLATVLGHEIGHVTARHHVTRLSRAQLAQIGLGVGGVLFPELQTLGGLAGAGLQLLFLQHGRDAERQADELGFGYALGQGFDVREMSAVFAALQRTSEQEQASALPSWLMTHPAPAERIESVNARLATLTATGTPLRIGGQAYMERIDGLVYGDNPRNGFFRDGLFLHPDLRFQIQFPRQWSHQNLAQAVMGISAQQDAAIQLTLAEAASADAAVRSFLSGQGIQAGQTGRATINGLPATVALFRAQAEQGTLQGLVAFIEHDGRVFQIVAYSPVARFAGYEQVFDQAIRSFQPLTDPEALGVQPDRVSIVRLPEAMDLNRFNQRYPSTIPIDELAIINHVASAGTVLPGGTLMKRVVRG